MIKTIECKMIPSTIMHRITGDVDVEELKRGINEANEAINKIAERIIPLLGITFQELFVALVTAILSSILFAPPGKVQVSSFHPKRSWYAWVWRFAVSSLSYIIFYFIYSRPCSGRLCEYEK